MKKTRDEMIKILLLLLFLTFLICEPAYSHSLEAINVNESATEAVLRDTVTGDEWMVQTGDEISGYRVIKITKEFVTIANIGEDQKVYVTKIHINGGNQTMKANP
jgi:hypothetical protein